MEPLLHIISPVSAVVVAALFAAVWQGAILAACVAVCLRMMPRLSAAARSIVWLNVFLVLILLHALPALLRRGASAGLEQPSPIHFDPRWSLAIAFAWAVLSLGKAAQLAATAVRVHRLAARAIPIETAVSLSAELSTNRGRVVELCTSLEVERPSVLGFFRPRILFPPALLESLSPDEVRQVVVHEMEHLNRGDDWTNLLQKIGLVLFPLNPALMWVERRLCHERELACDDRVLHSCCGRKAYAICLTRLAEYTLLHRGLTLVLGAWERRPELVRRVHRILRRPIGSLSPRKAMAATAGLSVVALVLAAGLARSPQLVSFAPVSAMQAQTLPSPDLQPVNLRTSLSLPRPQLVKAVMPAGLNQINAAPKPIRAAATRRKPKRPAPLRQQSQPAWVVLTDWDSEMPAPRVVIAVDQLNRPAFAAVQFANGWLIVQI
jgi:hypothetical protein